jgi:hypothetical protein
MKPNIACPSHIILYIGLPLIYSSIVSKSFFAPSATFESVKTLYPIIAIPLAHRNAASCASILPAAKAKEG